MTTRNPGPTAGSRGEDIATEGIEHVLANSRRRYALYCLFLYANPMRLPDVADQVTVWEHADLPETYERERLRIYNSLYHDHLPVLRASGIVTYHQSDDMVELGPAASRIESEVQSYLVAEIDELLEAEGQSMAHN